MLTEMQEKFATKKSLGQHFLNSPVVPNWLCDAAEVTPGDTVVEVGPGTGALTEILLNRGATVIALEADRRAIAVLEEKFADHVADQRLMIHNTDVRRFRPETLGLPDHGYKVVSNIPYYLTGHLFRVFLESENQPSSLIFLVQKEVAKRATTSLERKEKESLLSLSLQAFGQPIYIKTVGRGHFTPAPKVDSAIIKVANINRDAFQNLPVTHFFEVLHLGFGSKRKQLLGNLAKVYDRTQLIHLFSTLDIQSDIRAEDLPLSTWLKLVAALPHK